MTAPGIDEIRDAVRGRQGWGIAALQQLIAIDSISPEEKPCQLALADILQAAGLEVALVPYDDGSLTQTTGYIDSGLPREDRPNLITGIGTIDGGGRSLILNSHIDTVIWRHTLDKWNVHPLSGEIKEGRLYGRGSMDAKGQVMTAVVAALALKDLGYWPRGRVMIQSVVSEEPDGNGTLALCSQGYVADAAINLEATENRIGFGHRGVIGLRYTLAGDVRHASVRAGAANVIVQAGKLAEALDHSLDGWSHETDAIYTPPTVNIGRISGGDDIYTTPFGCTMDVGVRYAPGTYDAIVAEMDAAIRRGLGDLLPDLPGVVEAQFMLVDAASMPVDHPFVRAFHDALRAVDPDRDMIAFPAGCDVRHFINQYHMPAVIFGPGELALAHGENEYLDLAQWERASQALALFITRWCD